MHLFLHALILTNLTYLLITYFINITLVYGSC